MKTSHIALVFLLENTANNKDYEVFKSIDNQLNISRYDCYHIYQLINNIYYIYSDLSLNDFFTLDSLKFLFESNTESNEHSAISIMKSDCLYDADNYFYDVINMFFN